LMLSRTFWLLLLRLSTIITDWLVSLHHPGAKKKKKKEEKKSVRVLV